MGKCEHAGMGAMTRHAKHVTGSQTGAYLINKTKGGTIAFVWHAKALDSSSVLYVTLTVVTLT